jgi:hypothetical protein
MISWLKTTKETTAMAELLIGEQGAEIGHQKES